MEDCLRPIVVSKKRFIFFKLLIFLNTIKSDNQSDTTEPADGLCDPFTRTKISKISKKKYYLGRTIIQLLD